MLKVILSIRRQKKKTSDCLQSHKLQSHLKTQCGYHYYITFNRCFTGNEFLEKCLKLTQIRDFGRLMTFHGRSLLYNIYGVAQAISRCSRWRWRDPECNRKSEKVKLRTRRLAHIA